MTTFGLRNKNGSCWINAALQAVFRIPEFQARLDADEADNDNPVETCLGEIWASRGDEGLKDFYDCVKTVTMPAGEDIGDSHELIEFLCDKVPFLDKLLRFRVGYKITCKSCEATEIREDTLTEFSITPTKAKQSVSEAIAEAVQPQFIEGWRCDKCKKQEGCTKQLLLSSFPDVMMFHQTSVKTSVTYPPVLVVNKQRYALFAVVCFTGGHWLTWGRNLPPGNPWYKFDDTHVASYDPKHFPLAENTMRLLMYSRLKE